MSDTTPKLVIASDHAGFELKQHLIDHLREKGFSPEDMGPSSADSVDYPDFAHPLADKVASGGAEFGLLMCGSANGVAMTANKHPGIRAAICWKEDIAQLARAHNNANVICLPGRFVSKALAARMVDIFLNTPFEGGRHERRTGKIPCGSRQGA